MKATGAALQGALAVVGLAAAYTTWQRETPSGQGEVTVVGAAVAEVQKVHYEDGTGAWYELERRDSGVWMKQAGKEATPGGVKLPDRVLRTTEQGERLYKKFAPLRAVRSLGKLGDDKLKELGLDKPKKRLEIALRGEKRTFGVGSPPIAVSEPYLRDERDGTVYVLASGFFADLDAASLRLVDRRFHKITAEDFRSATLTAGGASRELVRVTTENPSVQKWATRENPTKEDETFRNWHNQLWGLSAIDVLGEGEQPQAGAAEIVLRVDYLAGKDKKVGFAEVGRVQHQAKDTTTATPGPVELYVRTEYSAGWMRVTGSAENMINEGIKLASTQ